jgi:hypothetical protein
MKAAEIQLACLVKYHHHDDTQHHDVYISIYSGCVAGDAVICTVMLVIVMSLWQTCE